VFVRHPQAIKETRISSDDRQGEGHKYLSKVYFHKKVILKKKDFCRCVDKGPDLFSPKFILGGQPSNSQAELGDYSKGGRLFLPKNGISACVSDQCSSDENLKRDLPPLKVAGEPGIRSTISGPTKKDRPIKKKENRRAGRGSRERPEASLIAGGATFCRPRVKIGPLLSGGKVVHCSGGE